METATSSKAKTPTPRQALDLAIMCEMVDMCLHKDRGAARLQLLAGAEALTERPYVGAHAPNALASAHGTGSP